MDLVQFLKKGMVWVQSDIEKQEDLFQMVAESGKSEGYVTDDFLTRLTDREQTFPTGLKLDGYGVALPHGSRMRYGTIYRRNHCERWHSI